MDGILTAKKKAPVETCAEASDAKDATVPVVVCSEDQGETAVQSIRREAVQDVLRSHIQEILRLLNERDERAETQSLEVHLTKQSPTSPKQLRLNERLGPRTTPPPRFEDFDDASPDERQNLLMDVYFEVVRPRVVPRAAFSADRRASLGGGQRQQSLPNMRGGERSISRGPSLARPPSSSRHSSSTGPVTDEDESDVDVAVTSDADDDEEAQGENGVAVNAAAMERRGRSQMPLSAQPASHDVIWCTLVFGMICCRPAYLDTIYRYQLCYLDISIWIRIDIDISLWPFGGYPS